MCAIDAAAEPPSLGDVDLLDVELDGRPRRLSVHGLYIVADPDGLNSRSNPVRACSPHCWVALGHNARLERCFRHQAISMAAAEPSPRLPCLFLVRIKREGRILRPSRLGYHQNEQPSKQRSGNAGPAAPAGPRASERGADLSPGDATRRFSKSPEHFHGRYVVSVSPHEFPRVPWHDATSSSSDSGAGSARLQIIESLARWGTMMDMVIRLSIGSPSGSWPPVRKPRGLAGAVRSRNHGTSLVQRGRGVIQ